jgi:GAF domain-containing protein
MHSWSSSFLRSLSYAPRPTDDPRAHATGVDSDRVLLFGGGASVGWGVSSHDLALPGALARALATLTGRGSDVDVIARPGFVAGDAIRELAGVDLERYDAIVLTLGLSESVQLASLRVWRRDIDELLDYLATRLSSRARIYLLGVHSVTTITGYDRLLAPIAAQHRRELNRVTAELCARDGRATFIPFDQDRGVEKTRDRSADEYRDGGFILAEIIAPALDEAFDESRATTPIRMDEESRQRAVDALRILDTPPEERFDRIVAFAQRAFRARYAALTIIDNDRQWQKSAAGTEREEVDRVFSICATTMQLPGELIVPDTLADERFPHPPTKEGKPPVRFYAGFPIEAPEGQRIGALCVLDTAPRDESTIDRALLRDLALMVQREVWRGARA